MNSFFEKIRVLSLKNLYFRPSKKASWGDFSPKRGFSRPKSTFFEWQDLHFFLKAVHKGLNFIWKFFGKDLSSVGSRVITHGGVGASRSSVAARDGSPFSNLVGVAVGDCSAFPHSTPHSKAAQACRTSSVNPLVSANFFLEFWFEIWNTGVV